MAEAFIDLYEVLELPIDADRNALRKRINELYLDAQRNLDHRNFQTRVRFQELFEVTLPQARYILLDDGRRDEYDRLVRAFRTASQGGVPAPAPTKAAPVDTGPQIPGTAPDIGALPTATADPALLASEREALWAKWKNGLESALADSEDRPRSRSAATTPPPAPTHSFAAAHTAPAPSAPSQPVSQAAPPPAPADQGSRGKRAVNFNFDSEKFVPKRGESAPVPGAEEVVENHKEGEVERRRDQRRREAIKEILVNVGLVWSSVGYAAVGIPMFFLLMILSSLKHFPVPLGLLWLAGIAIGGVGGAFLARELSKKKRQQTVAELSQLSFEELMRRVGGSV